VRIGGTTQLPRENEIGRNQSEPWKALSPPPTCRRSTEYHTSMLNAIDMSTNECIQHYHSHNRPFCALHCVAHHGSKSYVEATATVSESITMHPTTRVLIHASGFARQLFSLKGFKHRHAVFCGCICQHNQSDILRIRIRISAFVICFADRRRRVIVYIYARFVQYWFR
jgi:hypothetical protein